MSDDFPTASFEYGHRPTRDERSAEVYRIGGLMDTIDAWEITKQALMEIGLTDEHADRVSKAIFARLADAPEAPILPCRIYDAPEVEALAVERERHRILAALENGPAWVADLAPWAYDGFVAMVKGDGE